MHLLRKPCGSDLRLVSQRVELKAGRGIWLPQYPAQSLTKVMEVSQPQGSRYSSSYPLPCPFLPSNILWAALVLDWNGSTHLSLEFTFSFFIFFQSGLMKLLLFLPCQSIGFFSCVGFVSPVKKDIMDCAQLMI